MSFPRCLAFMWQNALNWLSTDTRLFPLTRCEEHIGALLQRTEKFVLHLHHTLEAHGCPGTANSLHTAHVSLQYEQMQ